MKYYDYINARQEIFIKKSAGLPKPWSDDPIFQDWSFCNVYRDDDRGSQWYINNLRTKYQASHKYSLFAVVAYRWFNLPATGETLVACDSIENWDAELLDIEIAKQDKFLSAAYRIAAPSHGTKLQGILSVLDKFHANLDTHVSEMRAMSTAKARYEYLQTILYFGHFNSYQFMVDLSSTIWGDTMSDRETWASAGPGAVRGLNRIHGRELDHNSKKIDYLAEILELREQNDTVYSLTAMDVQHSLCEFDKWHRVNDGGRMKRKFSGVFV